MQPPLPWEVAVAALTVDPHVVGTPFGLEGDPRQVYKSVTLDTPAVVLVGAVIQVCDACVALTKHLCLVSALGGEQLWCGRRRF